MEHRYYVTDGVMAETVALAATALDPAGNSGQASRGGEHAGSTGQFPASRFR